MMHRAVCPAHNFAVCRADRPASSRAKRLSREWNARENRLVPTRDNLFALDDTGRSALQTAKLCAGRTALCIIFATQGSPPSNQQNSAQGGPPCASYLLPRAVRPPTSKTVRRADRPVHHICYIGQSALQPSKQCTGRTFRIYQ